LNLTIPKNISRELQSLRETALSLFLDNGMNPESEHGPEHWDTVGLNAAILLSANNLNPITGFVFGTLHDCLRENEEDDPYHGHRAAGWIKNNRKRLKKLDLTEDEIDCLEYAALIHHTGETPDHGTIEGCCTDADRLDLGRVGISLNSRLFSSNQAVGLIRGTETRIDTTVGTLVVLYHGSRYIDREDEAGTRIRSPKKWVPAYLTENEEIAKQYGELHRVLLTTPPPIDFTDPMRLIHEPVFKILQKIQKAWKKEKKTWPESGDPLDLFTVLESGALYQIDFTRELAESFAQEVTEACGTPSIRIYEDSNSHHQEGRPVPTWMTFAKTNVILW
jgi:uncharacterized protein